MQLQSTACMRKMVWVEGSGLCIGAHKQYSKPIVCAFQDIGHVLYIHDVHKVLRVCIVLQVFQLMMTLRLTNHLPVSPQPPPPLSTILFLHPISKWDKPCPYFHHIHKSQNVYRCENSERLIISTIPYSRVSLTLPSPP